jgi:hypothetical protein
MSNRVLIVSHQGSDIIKSIPRERKLLEGINVVTDLALQVESSRRVETTMEQPIMERLVLNKQRWQCCLCESRWVTTASTTSTTSAAVPTWTIVASAAVTAAVVATCAIAVSTWVPAVSTAVGMGVIARTIAGINAWSGGDQSCGTGLGVSRSRHGCFIEKLFVILLFYFTCQSR